MLIQAAANGGGVKTVNGKTGELIRWIAAWVIAAIVAYFSGQIATERRFGALEARVESSRLVEQQHFEEILRRLDRMERILDRQE